jgi:maltose phosphorylase
MRIKDDRITLNPSIPEKWKSYSFHARFREVLFEAKVTGSNIVIKKLSGKILRLVIQEKYYEIKGAEKLTVRL